MAVNRYKSNGRRGKGGEPSAHAILAKHGGDIVKAKADFWAAMDQWKASGFSGPKLVRQMPDFAPSREALVATPLDDEERARRLLDLRGWMALRQGR